MTWVAEAKKRRAALERLEVPTHIADWARTEGEPLLASASDVPKLLKRVDALELALNELKGFAERNEKRAKQALKDAEEKSGNAHPDDRTVENMNAVIEAEARFHDAVRFRQVIVERVKEVLAS